MVSSSKVNIKQYEITENNLLFIFDKGKITATKTTGVKLYKMSFCTLYYPFLCNVNNYLVYKNVDKK